MYLLILIFNFFYIATSGIVFYYKKSDYNLSGSYDVQYTFYTIFYFGEKVTFELVNWIFAYKYWCVSLTLRQALSNNEMKFSEKFQFWVFWITIIVTVALSAADSSIFYVSEANKCQWRQLTDITFFVYFLSLSFSLLIFIIAICRIGKLLKDYQQVRLNETHMWFLAVQLIISVVLNLALSMIYITH